MPCQGNCAAVLVLESDRYLEGPFGQEPVQVSRRGGNFHPVCLDDEGTRTILLAFADDAVFRVKGSNEQEIEQKLAEGFEQSQYRPLSRSGIAYMLSPATYMVHSGKLAPVQQHPMFHSNAPFLTNADIGGWPGRPRLSTGLARRACHCARWTKGARGVHERASIPC
jgi:hypothetical protein